MDERSTVPPRREAIIQQYTAAHEEACLAKDEAEKVQGWAEAANDRRDFTGASHFWERSHRATGLCKRHREAELELRKEEYALYNHLDDENERKGLFKLIQYSERRIERLHNDMSKRLVKSRISHLKQYLAKQETKVRMIEKRIIEEDLHNKAKGRSNIAFGSGWDEVGDGWGHRPPQKKDVRQNVQTQAADRLRWLEGQKKYAIQQAENSIDEIKQNEMEWEAIRAEEQARDDEWARLDEDARRHWAGLPVREYQAEAYKALERRKKEEAEAYKRERYAEETRQEEMRVQREEQQKHDEEVKREADEKQKVQDMVPDQETELQVVENGTVVHLSTEQTQDKDSEQEAQADEQARWEEEYALEEDPNFAWQPQTQPCQEEPHSVNESIGQIPASKIPDTTAEAAPSRDMTPTAKNNRQGSPYVDQGWGADFDKALLEGNNDLTVGLSAESGIGESMFAEFLEQSAFTEDESSSAN